MTGEVIRRRRTVTVRRYARRQLFNANGEHTGSTTDYQVFTDSTHDVELAIDIDGLFRALGEKAARSITGRATGLSALIIARRLKKGAAA